MKHSQAKGGREAGPTQRQLRAGELVRHALAAILREETLQDPALTHASVTVTEVRMSPDLKHAICFVEPLGAAFVGSEVKGDPVHGWICLDKPLDLTSTDAVSRVRRLFNAQKGGHAGTLDPLATGILPIALGEATKTVPFLMEAGKTYRFTVAWGATTASFDREGEIVATSDVRPSPEAVADALPAFVGEIMQVPPIYSAIKVDGERAYDLARAGVEVVLEQRLVTIHSARVADVPDPDHIEIEIECGKGTYVRAVVRDLALALGACGHVSALRRTRVGAFTEARSISLDKLTDLVHRGAGAEA